MSTLLDEAKSVTAETVRVTTVALQVSLSDGRNISVPLAWFPRLQHGSQKERNNWRLIGRGEGMHWPDLDEDVSIEGLLLGHASGESQESFKRWLGSRTRKGRLPS